MKKLFALSLITVALGLFAVGCGQPAAKPAPKTDATPAASADASPAADPAKPADAATPGEPAPAEEK